MQHVVSMCDLELRASYGLDGGAGMVTGELKSKIDAVWNDFWSGGISNPPEVMDVSPTSTFDRPSTTGPAMRRSACEPTASERRLVRAIPARAVGAVALP